MRSYENNGFSLNANVRIPSWDREGLERLIRYCARPCFVSENLRWNGLWINYRLPKPTRDGKRFIQIDSLELIVGFTIEEEYMRFKLVERVVQSDDRELLGEDEKTIALRKAARHLNLGRVIGEQMKKWKSRM